MGTENKSFEKEEIYGMRQEEDEAEDWANEADLDLILDKKLLETITENQNSPYSTQVTVLYCTVLYCKYCTVLYCTVLYCNILYCTVLYCTQHRQVTVSQDVSPPSPCSPHKTRPGEAASRDRNLSTAPCSSCSTRTSWRRRWRESAGPGLTVLYCTVLYCTVLYYTVLYCSVLYCTVLYCTGPGLTVWPPSH